MIGEWFRRLAWILQDGHRARCPVCVGCHGVADMPWAIDPWDEYEVDWDDLPRTSGAFRLLGTCPACGEDAWCNGDRDRYGVTWEGADSVNPPGPRLNIPAAAMGRWVDRRDAWIAAVNDPTPLRMFRASLADARWQLAEDEIDGMSTDFARARIAALLADDPPGGHREPNEPNEPIDPWSGGFADNH